MNGIMLYKLRSIQQSIHLKQPKILHRDIRHSIFCGTEQLFLGTQAFASPTDLASSGVWEIYNIILENCQKDCFFLIMLTDGKSTFNVGYDRCYCHVIYIQDVVGRCYLPRI